MINTGYTKLDNVLNSFKTGELVIVGSRPSHGKTILLLNLLSKIIKENSCSFLSLDLSENEILSKLVGIEPEIQNNNHVLNIESLKKGCNFSNILESLENNLKKGIKVFFIDFLQMINTPVLQPRKRKQELDNIIYELKAFADNNEALIIAASQVDKTVEKRGGNMNPILSDLSDINRGVFYFDKVLFSTIPENYGYVMDEDGNSLKNILNLRVAQNKNGRTETISFSINSEKYILNEI